MTLSSAPWSRTALIGWALIMFVLLAYELWCVLAGDKATPPLTWVVTNYVPAWVTLPILVWLLLHFTVVYAHLNKLRNNIF